MTRYTRFTIAGVVRVCQDVDGYVSILNDDDAVVLTLGKAVRVSDSPHADGRTTGWHAFPMNDDGTLWSTPCYLRTRDAAIRYMLNLTAHNLNRPVVTASA